jgi:uncharacterized protein YbjT (DUF2867 family)
MTILITGVPGNVGTPLVAELAAQRADMRVGTLPSSGAELAAAVARVPFDFTVPDTYPAAFAGADRMFLLRPPQLSNVKRDIVPALEAARSAGVRHVVFLSIQGAERNRVVPHHAVEQWLRSSGMTWTFVRAAYFMQNLTTTHGPELARGEIFVPAGRARTALVDARDRLGLAAGVTSDVQAVTDRPPHDFQAFARGTSPSQVSEGEIR